MATYRPAYKAATRIFHTQFKLDPKPVNPATHKVTKHFLEHGSHPFHPRVKRQFDAFDPKRLYVLVIAPNYMKSAAIRRHAVRRVRSLLSEVLKEKGYNWDGTVRRPPQVEEFGGRRSLHGAYSLRITDTPAALNVSADVIRKQCDELVDTMERNARSQHAPSMKRSLYRPESQSRE